MPRSLKTALGLILAFQMMFCGGCASNPATVTKLVPIPPELTEPVAAPELQGDQNKDLVSWIDGWREALKEANRRLESIGNIKP